MHALITGKNATDTDIRRLYPHLGTPQGFPAAFAKANGVGLVHAFMASRFAGGFVCVVGVLPTSYAVAFTACCINLDKKANN